MDLILYYHPLSSCCHKVLVALYELGIPFGQRFLDFGDAAQRDAFLALSPTGKMPLLVDGAQVVPETSVIIEYLVQRHAPAGQALLPADAGAALEVRLLDRLLDFYVMTPLQAIVGDRIRTEADRDAVGVGQNRTLLRRTYTLLEQRLGAPAPGGASARQWMASDAFSLADCAAGGSLFYAHTLEPFGDEHPRLASYFERLIARPSVARVLEEARPYFSLYPYREAVPQRFL